MRRLAFSLALLALPVASRATLAAPFAVRADTSGDRARFDRLMAFAVRERLAERPFGEIVQALGERLRGAPYAAGVLDVPRAETLLAPLDRFDCVLFVEAVVAAARGVADGDRSHAGFLRRVAEQRYREGRFGGYGDRLHYFSDWIADGAARGLVVDLTAGLGGRPYPKRIDYMTRHRSAYPHLADPAAFAAVAAAERSLAAEQRFFVPKARVRELYSRLQPGDIVTTTTDLDGLDVTHTGFAYVTGAGTVGFLHASPTGGVKVSPDLAAYLAGNPRQTGVLVVRPLPVD